MPTFRIDLPPAAVARLQAVVQNYNANTGKSLTVAQWIRLHLLEIAFHQELSEVRQRLERQKQQELEDEYRAEWEQIVGSH